MTVQINGTTGITTPDITSNTQTVITELATTITATTLNTTNLNVSGVASYAPRSWGTFTGTTTGTFSPTSGQNVSSITRNSTGSYTVTFTSALANANYAVTVGISGVPGYNTGCATVGTKTTSGFSFTVTGISGTTNTSADATSCNFIVIL